MSHKLRSVNTKFWDDSFISELNPTEKLLFLYLITNSLTNLIGIYEISLRKIAFDTGLNSDIVKKGLERFETVKKAFYIENYIVLPNWLKNQNLNHNMKISVEKEFEQLPNQLKSKILLNDSEPLPNDYETIRNALETIRDLNRIESNIIINRIESKSLDFDFVELDFKDCFLEFIEFKKARNESYKNQKSLEAAYKKLKKLSNNEPQKAKEVVEQTMANNWAGLFELKENNLFIKKPEIINEKGETYYQMLARIEKGG